MEDDKNWKWYASSNGEIFDIGPCETKDSAIEEAADSECGYDYTREDGLHILAFEVIEAIQSPIRLSDFMSGQSFFDDLINNHEWFYDSYGEEPIIEPKIQELDELTLLFKQALDSWQDKYYPELRTRIFTNQRNSEKIYMRGFSEFSDYKQITSEEYLNISSEI